MIVCHQEGDDFIATCKEFPSLSWVAESEYDAIRGLESLLAEVRQEIRESTA